MELQMKKKEHTNVMSIPLVKGAIITIWGILSILLAQSAPLFLIRTFGILNLVVGVLTVWFTYKYPFLKISRQWLILEAGTEFAAGFVFTFLISTVPDFVYYISIGIFFIIILQFIYGFALLNSGEYNYWNIVIRFVTLFIGSVIGVVLFMSIVTYTTAIVIVGIFSIIYGIINVQYGLQLKNSILGRIR